MPSPSPREAPEIPLRGLSYAQDAGRATTADGFGNLVRAFVVNAPALRCLPLPRPVALHQEADSRGVRPAVELGQEVVRAQFVEIAPPSTSSVVPDPITTRHAPGHVASPAHTPPAPHFAAASPSNARRPRISPGPLTYCALGRIRTCNLLIRSQMLYPLSYECLFCFLAVPCPFGPLAATGRTLHDCRSHVKSVCRSHCDLRKHPSEQGTTTKPRSLGPGLR
jgi:hypothetical protein